MADTTTTPTTVMRYAGKLIALSDDGRIVDFQALVEIDGEHSTLSGLSAEEAAKLRPYLGQRVAVTVSALGSGEDEARARAAAAEPELVDASDDPAAMSAALLELARELGCDCNLDDMLHAIDKLQRDAEDVDGLRDSLEKVRARATEGLRMLWLVVREAGAPGGITIPVRSMAATDWSTCALRRDDDLANGTVHLVAVSRGEPVNARRTQHQAMHQQLLDMLGASDHQGAAARIGELAGLELLLTTGGAGRGVTAIAQERRRQIEGERFDPTADQQYRQGELARAAACYVRLEAMRSVAAAVPGTAVDDRVPPEWPWARCWWKPKDRRSNLVRAGALIAAELDRMDREGAANA